MKAGKWLGTAAILVLTGTAVLWINGRWPTGGFRVPEWAFTGTGDNGRDAGKDSTDQGRQIRGMQIRTMRLKTMWPRAMEMRRWAAENLTDR